jgi:transcriptional regulator with PAS, ATPase and Fis domain
VISATNRNLEHRVKEGAFREDLYYRLNVVLMSLPPLRERKEDIPILIEYFLKRFTEDNGKEIAGLSSEAQDVLLKYDYPGNVRELENIMERAVVIARDAVISLEDLPFRESIEDIPAGRKAEEGLLRGSIEELERNLIVEAMGRAGDHQSHAAELLGISERMLRYKLKKYGLKAG